MAQRRDAQLRRHVAGPAVAGAVFGNVAAAVFVVLGVTATKALGLTPLVFVAAGLVFLLVALTYAEGIAALPQAGGSSGFARRAFNELASFIAAWALILDYLIVVAISAYFAARYLASFPGLSLWGEVPWNMAIGVLLIAGVGVLNLRGGTINASLNVVVALVALVSQLALALVGLLFLFDPASLVQSVDLGVTPAWDGLLFALPIAMIGFTGLEVAANMSGELREPGRVARPIIGPAVVGVATYVALSVVALMALPVTGSGPAADTELGIPGDGGYADRPVVGIVEQLPVPAVAEGILTGYMCVLAVAVLFLSANTSIGGMSRLVYSMSLHRQLPSALARIDRSRGSPKVAVLLFSLTSAGLLVLAESLRSSALVLAQLYAFGAMLSFTIATASIIWLRVREPELVRPFRTPLNVRLAGRNLSLVAIAALGCSAAMWMLTLLTHPAARALGIGWMVLGFVGYGTYRLTHGQTLTDRYEPRLVERAPVTMRPYRRILIAVRPERGRLYGAGDAELAALAAKLMDDDLDGDAELAVMLVHELPLTQPLGAPLGPIEAETAERLSRLRASTEQMDLRLTSTIARARAAGRAICQEAARREADAVVLATRQKRRAGDAVFGRTVQYVLRHAPCDVVILNLPEESLRPANAGGAAAAGTRARADRPSDRLSP